MGRKMSLDCGWLLKIVTQKNVSDPTRGSRRSGKQRSMSLRLIIYDVPRSLTKKDFLEAVRNQNTDLRKESFDKKAGSVFLTGKKKLMWCTMC